jgi:hypothetical protein
VEAALDASDEDGPTIRVRVRCTPAVRERWGFVHEIAERVAGQRLRANDALELVVAEAASAFPLDAAGSSKSAPGSEPAGRCAFVTSGGDPPFAALRHAADEKPGAPRRPAALPPNVAALVEGLDSADAFELDRRLRAAVHLEQTLDASIAPWLRLVAAADHEWNRHGCALAACARDHLGMSPGKARSLVRLERAAEICPELRSAWRDGRISWVKARVLLPLLLLELEGTWRAGWVSWAEGVTVRRLEQDVARALLLRALYPAAAPIWLADPSNVAAPAPPEARSMCAHDVDVNLDATEQLVFHLPREVAAMLAALLQRHSFAALLEHALATWLEQDPEARRPDPVIERDGYRCVVPGCSSRRNLHDHHIRFRAQGGDNDPANRVTLCAFHHLRCLHAGFMSVRGIAPDALVFELGVRAEGLPPLARYGSGDRVLSDSTRLRSRSASPASRFQVLNNFSGSSSTSS